MLSLSDGENEWLFFSRALYAIYRSRPDYSLLRLQKYYIRSRAFCQQKSRGVRRFLTVNRQIQPIGNFDFLPFEQRSMIVKSIRRILHYFFRLSPLFLLFACVVAVILPAFFSFSCALFILIPLEIKRNVATGKNQNTMGITLFIAAANTRGITVTPTAIIIYIFFILAPLYRCRVYFDSI